MKTLLLPVKRLPHALEALPAYKTEGAVGMDLQAAISEPLTLSSLERCLVSTGLVIALPEGFEAQLRARSGLSVKHGITLINGIGTIDWDYRDEIKVGLVNLSHEAYTILPGDRIAQLVVAPVTRAQWQEVTHIDLCQSRSGGFGSTGV
jgi:dUTP pyrophosphatase